MRNPDGVKIAALRNTTRSGVASFALPLAAELGLGTYRLGAEAGGAEAHASFRVERYVLPKFSVTVEGTLVLLVSIP